MYSISESGLAYLGERGMDNGAKKALIPIENKRSFFDGSAEVLGDVDPIFYGDVKQAAFKALGLT
jgi:hypothetical protein